MKKVMLLLFSLLLIYPVSAVIHYVPFNGEFKNGTTLFSDSIPVTNSALYGYDVYPIRSFNLICTDTVYLSPKRICEQNLTGYINITRRTCTYSNYIQDCTVRIIQNPVYKTYCHTIYIQKTRTTCRTDTTLPIGCLNPDGVYTNQLSLSNFRFSNDSGSTWFNVPYGINQIYIKNQTLIFKVEIPALCSPTYNINKSIVLAS